MTTADALPGDMPGLRAAALALIAERDELLRRVERMRQLIRQFQRAQFGRHSERLDPDQLHASLVTYLASDLAHFVNGTMIEIDGGQQKPLMDRFRDR